MAAAMIVLVCHRLRRIERQIKGLLERFQAGRLPGARAAREGGGTARTVPVAAAVRLPRGFGWLLAMVPHQAACFAGHLGSVLAEAEMVALLEAAPQARRILAPLCRMLGMERPGPRPGPRGEAEGAGAATRSVVRVRAARAPVEPERIPLPRGVLAAARRQGYGKRR
jgi:hypothetical protein